VIPVGYTGTKSTTQGLYRNVLYQRETRFPLEIIRKPYRKQSRGVNCWRPSDIILSPKIWNVVSSCVWMPGWSTFNALCDGMHFQRTEACTNKIWSISSKNIGFIAEKSGACSDRITDSSLKSFAVQFFYVAAEQSTLSQYTPRKRLGGRGGIAPTHS
jgi:hypothetical protein